MPKQPLLKRFLIWRYRHISQKNFVYILSMIVGLLAGLTAVTLKNLTFTIQKAIEQGVLFSTTKYYFILPVIGLFLVYLITKNLKKSAREFAIPSILYALSKKAGIIAKSKIYYPLILAPLTVGFGGSVGLLGPAVTSGTALSSNLGKLLHVDRKTRTLLIGCAAAGAVSSIFKSPLAAIIFAVEVFSLDLTFISLLPLLFASVSAVITSYFFLGDDIIFNFTVTDGFKFNDIFFYVILGVFTGMASVYFTKMYFTIIGAFKRIKKRSQKLIIGGLAIGAMLYIIPPLYGEGFGFINSLLNGDHLAAIGKTPFDAYLDNIWVVIALLISITVFKAVAMTTTFAAGGVGGIFIPTLVMGAALGNGISKIINHLGLGIEVSETNFTLIGMGGLIAGVLHAPLTAIFLIAEITGGYELFLPLMIAISISFVISKNTLNYSIYTKELLRKGELLTHDKDQSVLTIMSLDSVIEHNFVVLHPEMTLGQMVHDGVSKSTRNLFPVTDEDCKLVGVILLDDIREFMFNQSLYEETNVKDFMHGAADTIIYESDSMQKVMTKFQNSSAWNLPVIKDGKYYGFISKSKLLTAYRRQLINFTK
ncbi:MAG: chloride channel protein [Bacteroidetes bacterium MedPE-SWsnd-G2]|nr:MAG: chloride channel protein [Bacteroidetes bacterium MedPE-SWsnd-G2]